MASLRQSGNAIFRSRLADARVVKGAERFALKGNVFFLHTPDSFGKLKLAERTERLLGVHATARNWRTVTTLIEMPQEY